MATSGIPFLPTHWYYNTETGQLTQGNNLENLGNNLVGGLGWHELNIPGNATEAQAAAEAKKEFPSGAAPTNAGITPGRVVSQAAKDAGASITSGFKVVLGGTTGLLTRILKVVIGGVLIIVGVMHLSGTDKKLTDIAGKAALFA